MSKLRLAISGGGIASICLAHALVAQHPQWDVKVFEARADAELRDDGGAFGLASNAQTALALISADLRAALDEAGAVRMDPSFRLMMASDETRSTKKRLANYVPFRALAKTTGITLAMSDPL